MSTPPKFNVLKVLLLNFSLTMFYSQADLLHAQGEMPSMREPINLSGSDWQFSGSSENDSLPELNSDAYKHAAWTNISVPHNFQTRSDMKQITKGWYRRQITLDSSFVGKQIYLIFEGAAAISDVYVNGQHLGQHRGAYTRFIFDATSALHSGADNELAIQVDDSPQSTVDCLPSGSRLYKVWGGLYRKVWLLAVSPIHIDPTDAASPGVYLTPKNVSAASADLNIRVLLRNTSSQNASLEVRARIFDSTGTLVKSLTAPASISAQAQATVELSTTLDQPQLWEPLKGRLYQVKVGVYQNNQLVDSLTESTGFRWLSWDWQNGTMQINGKPTILYGANLHQEIETKGSAVADEDLKHNFDLIHDLGLNFLRLPHYPHARLEYDLCDQAGLLCWCENGNSNGNDQVGPTAAQITTEMVKQNYNHPSIVLWSVGNEASGQVADQCVPVVKALDSSRPVVVANMKSQLAEHHAANSYPGWYGGNMQSFKPHGFFSEIGAGGVTTIHCDYNQCDWKVDGYEPEEYQQLVAENHFQKAFHEDNSHLGLLCWWTLREFTDTKYKKPVGINSKGLLTHAGDKKDVYYLYRSFLRPDEPTLWITSKRYFLRRGAPDNGIKVYSNAPSVTLTLNGKIISTLQNGQYFIPDGPWNHHKNKKAPATEIEPKIEAVSPHIKVDNVFYWPVALQTGKNTVSVADDKGHTDEAVIYYYGASDTNILPTDNSPLQDLSSSNPKNPAFYVDAPVHEQWPIYTNLDSTADNSWNTVPDVIKDAHWIALRRVTKPEDSTDLSFTLSRAVKVYVVATQSTSDDFLTKAGFKEVPLPSFLWRDNELQLVPAKIYLHDGAARETIHLSMGLSDALVLFK